MKNIQELDTAIANREREKEANHTFFWAYYNTQKAENELLTFNDIVWDSDIEPILADCKRYGITEFAISSNFSGLLATVDKFTEYGCKIDGLIKVKSVYTDFRTGEQEIIPALKISV